MLNEYLFLDDKHKKEIETQKYDNVTGKIRTLENTSVWMATYSVPGKSEEIAKKLSAVHLSVSPHASHVLSCESSEYFNKMLYPHINEMERKLRKLVYLAASISDKEEAKKIIANLEEKDFGEIFTLLFTDGNFISSLKLRVNASANSGYEKKSTFTKNEILKHIQEMKEETTWVSILGESTVPSLRKKFRDAQSYRNDVMHAHNICHNTYEDAKKLFISINDELNKEIRNIIGEKKKDRKELKADINRSLSKALDNMKLQKMVADMKMTETINNIAASINKISDNNLAAQEIASLFKNMSFYDEDLKRDLIQSVEAFRKNINFIKTENQINRAYEALQPISSLSQQIQERLQSLYVEENQLYKMDSDVENRREQLGMEKQNQTISEEKKDE